MAPPGRTPIPRARYNATDIWIIDEDIWIIDEEGELIHDYPF
jgi:hypothetical protein